MLCAVILANLLLCNMSLNHYAEIETFLRDVEPHLNLSDCHPDLERVVLCAREALKNARDALKMTAMEGAREESPASAELVRMKLGRTTPEGPRLSFNVHTLEHQDRLAAFLAFVMGRA